MKNFSLLFLLLSFGFQTLAQYNNVLISNINHPEEPSITMNPANPNQLVAGANIRSYYFSVDGGSTWTRGQLTSPLYGVWGDPCLITDTAGNFYFLHLSNPPGSNWIDRIVCQRFDINNNVWTDGTYMGLNGTKAQDKEWAVVDSANNTIYVTWTQFDEYGTNDPSKYSNILFSKSSDMGETWSNAVQINEISGDCRDSDSTVEGAVPAVGPNGEIYVAWAGPVGIVFNRSLDGGQTWLDSNIFVSDQPGGWDYNVPGIYRCNGLPITSCDVSQSIYRGTIYVNWTDQRNGTGDTDVWLSKSTDGGNTWSTPLRVNDDPPGKQQFLSWMTVDGANGNVDIVFYDRRNYDDLNTDVYLARSTDGGETFENIKISESPFYPESGVFFGDYTNITAYNGFIHPIWTRADGSSLSVWTTSIDINVGLPVNNSLAPLSLQQNYPNPFNESTTIAFQLHQNAIVSLYINDIYGRKIATLVDNKFLETGKYIKTFDALNKNLKSGVYYFSLKSDDKLFKKKMIFIQ